MGFKRGDKVVCESNVNAGYLYSLTIGNVYEVMSVDFEFICIIGDNGGYGTYSGRRFVNIQKKRNEIIDEILIS